MGKAKKRSKQIFSSDDESGSDTSSDSSSSSGSNSSDSEPESDSSQSNSPVRSGKEFILDGKL